MYVLPYGQMSLWGIKNYYSTCVSTGANKPDKNFMAMFMGLVYGDGYIEIGSQKQYNVSGKIPKSTIRARLVIRLHSRDLSFLTHLTDVLGVGKISALKFKNSNSADQTRLIFSKKDLVTVIIPLIKQYNLQFLTNNRHMQFALLNHIIENKIIHWENVDYTPQGLNYSAQEIFNLSFFPNWLVGFTVTEGSFGFKSKGDAFFHIKPKGIENYNVLKAISLLIVDRVPNIKADSADNYKLSLTSKSDIQKVVYFFSASDTNLFGYKLIQYNDWLVNLKNSNRYKDTTIPH